MMMSDFVSLTSDLESWFETNWKDLPPEIQALLKRWFPPAVDINSADPRRPLPGQFVSAWDSFSSARRRSCAEQRDFERNPANDLLRDRMWELQPAITCKLKQLDDEIGLLETAPSTLELDSDTRESKLRSARLKREKLKADEAGYLAAAAPELRSAVERLMTAHPDLMTPSELVAQSSESASRQVSDQRPKPIDRLVRSWFQNRVETWPDAEPAPGEAADWKAINQHFAPGLSRNDFRLARREETPSGWRKQGRRPNWGVEKKSAG